MEMLIERIKQDNENRVIYLSFEPENSLAKRLYKKLVYEQMAGSSMGKSFIN
ncbi:hypothetical protein [Sporosarcina globispora]|uniref:hypothetical protein n=1 Tax=Sporosarcina globispora TaxID=1459 RepID=UPI001F39ACD6|nr:hypothetical protein [Sporosarcina globispora]